MAPLLNIALILGSLFIFNVMADIRNHRYQPQDKVTLYANQVGPFRNPQETYLYYSLPFCEPDKIVDVEEGLGEALQGYELIESKIDIRFKVDKSPTIICDKVLNPESKEKLIEAVNNMYWYQMFLDDLPIWGMVGVATKDAAGSEKPFVYTHKKFVITYNSDRVIEVNLTSENPVSLNDFKDLSFTYAVHWVETNTAFEQRFDKYLDDSFFEHQIHWFSIFNSFMMVIFLSGLVAMILVRTLRKDYARMKDEEDFYDDNDDKDEFLGWKHLHGDVFRPPSNLLLLSALIGIGHQLIILIFCVLFFSAIGTYYRTRGATMTALVLSYAFTSFVAGFGGGGFYARSGGKNWMKNMLLTATLLPLLSFVLIFCLNTIAHTYGSLNYVPFNTMLIVFLLWVFVSFPLTVFGTITGKNWNGQSAYPCRINVVPRRIPNRPWYSSRRILILLGGILPFGSIFIEMYFIFTSFWHYKYYYVYGFLLLVYIILIIVSVCVTIVSTYFLLNSEDWKWQWTAFLSSGSTALYVFLYGVYYFIFKTNMNGFLQTCFYFGYMSMFCFSLFILCGSLGFIGASVFVRRIYNDKTD